MLTLLTQTALAVLSDISCGIISARTKQYALYPHALLDVLVKLEAHNLIRLLPERSRDSILSYQLARPVYSITLLNVLEAMGENLNCNHELYEDFYDHYGTAARKLGVLNHVTRAYLSEIKLADL